MENDELNIKINDFDLFFQIIKSISKLTQAAKISIGQSGISIYGRNEFSRFEARSNALETNNDLEFCLNDLNLFLKVLLTVKETHENDYSGLKLTFDQPFIKVISKKIKTKINTCREDIIEKFVSKALKTELKNIFEFTTSSEIIKKLNSHSFLFQDTNQARVYLSIDSEMEQNAIYAEIANDSNPMANSLKIKFGIATSGTLENKIILDFDRMNAFNVIQSDEINIALTDKQVLTAKYNVEGKKDTYFKFNLYNTMRKQ